MTTSSRTELRALARELVVAQKAAADIGQRYEAAMIAELFRAPEGEGNPSVDLEIVEAMATLQVYAGVVLDLLATHSKGLVLCVLLRGSQDLAARIAEAARSGDAEGCRDCPCPKHKAMRAAGEQAVAAAVASSGERARRPA